MAKRVLAISGAYVAWVMGSGFATGQEILQFFTSYGYRSFIILLMNLVGFLLVGTAILEAGQAHRDDSGFNHFHYFCGEKLGIFFDWFLPVSLYAAMVILISGAGATLHEYYGINHYIGALIMASLAFLSYIAGFRRFVKIVSLIGPVIIAFTLFVGVVTVFRGFEGLTDVGRYQDVMAAKQPAPFWWLSAFLYMGYNLTGGSKYYTALGAGAVSRREALLGAVIGTVSLMISIFLMNTAMLTDIGNAAVRGVPTLYLARRISYALGAVFSVILIMGIFSACSAMMWTVSEKFVLQGTKKSYFFAAGVGITAFLLGLLPFGELVGKVYAATGYVGLIFVVCAAYKKIKGERRRAC